MSFITGWGYEREMYDRAYNLHDDGGCRYAYASLMLMLGVQLYSSGSGGSSRAMFSSKVSVMRVRSMLYVYGVA